MAKTVNVANKNRLCLLINETEKTIFCLCESAFYYSDLISFSVKKLNKDIGSLVICNDGTIREIINIEKKEILGNNLLEKFKSFLLGEYNIEVKFRNRSDIPIDKFKSIIKYIIKSNEFAYDYFFIDEDDKKAKEIILNKLEDAETYRDIIDAFACSRDKCLETF